MDAFIGTILPWAPTYAPRGWALCNGQQLTVSQYQAVYALLGVTYGGSPNVNFNLPNLCGRVPVGAGVLSGTSTNFTQGQSNGALQTVLTTSQVPLVPHTHTITNTTSATGGGTGTVNLDIKVPVNTDNQPMPIPTPPTYFNTPNENCVLGQAKQGTLNVNMYTSNSPTAGKNLKPFTASGSVTVTPPTVNVTSACAPAGVSATQSLSLMQPYQVINYIICLEGLWPERP